MSFTSSWLGVRWLTSQRAANSSSNNFSRPPGSTPLASISAAILRSKSVVRSAACEKHAVSRMMGPACNNVTNFHMYKNQRQGTTSISSEFLGHSWTEPTQITPSHTCPSPKSQLHLLRWSQTPLCPHMCPMTRLDTAHSPYNSAATWWLINCGQRCSTSLATSVQQDPTVVRATFCCDHSHAGSCGWWSIISTTDVRRNSFSGDRTWWSTKVSCSLPAICNCFRSILSLNKTTEKSFI